MARNVKRSLYLRPEEGLIKGVCAGFAHYLDVPVKLVRIIVVLSMFFGLFVLTVAAYVILAYWLEPAPADAYAGEGAASSRRPASERLDEVDAILRENEQHLRAVERYVTSDTFGVRNRFRAL